MKIRLLVVAITVVFASAALYIFMDSDTASPTADRLDVCLGDCLSHYPYEVGEYEVVIQARPLVSGDNGRAEITVVVDGSPAGVLESYFDYDLWTDEPAGYMFWRWIDDDLQLDLVIRLATGEEYVIGSQDGKLTQIK